MRVKGDKIQVRLKDNKVVATFLEYVPLGMKVYVNDNLGGRALEIPFDQIVYDEEPVAPLQITNSETKAKPERYTSGSLEVWDAIRQMNADFMQGNVIKYTMRYKHKHGQQDLKKAINYLVKILSEESGEDYYSLRKKSIDDLTS